MWLKGLSSCAKLIKLSLFNSSKVWLVNSVRMSSVKVTIQVSSPASLVPHVTAEVLKKQVPDIEVSLGQGTSVSKNGVSIGGAHAVARYLCRLVPGGATPLYGSTNLEKAEIDHWLEYSLTALTQHQNATPITTLEKLNSILAPRVYLVGYQMTLADLAVYSSLRGYKDLSPYPNITRWFEHVSSNADVAVVSSKMKSETTPTKIAQADVGKFVELPGAEMGKVVTRFPPEASGYLHIGHAKAALLNQHYQLAFKGKLVMRFDDTNPEKESVEFEKVILEDVAMLNVKPDIFSFTSDYFDLYLSYADKLIAQGLAYVDATPPEEMKKMRENRIEAPNRNSPVEENQRLWEEMKVGSDLGLTCCLRVKIDMQSDNGCLRDPTIYRCKLVPHPRHGNKYKVYPTYDFACPIVDSIEGVTHALRTTEYHDRDPQYSWFCKHLDIREPYVYEYSRLNLQNTVLSKRKLRWFVEQGIVSGWEDPRFPTVRGVLRHGMTVEGLKQFIVSQGSSRAIVMMEWDKLWSCNRKVIEPISPRHTAILREGVVPLLLPGVKEHTQMKPKHPKNPDVGTKEVWYSPRVVVEREDALPLQEGDKITLINWGNVILKKIEKDASGDIVHLEGELALQDEDYKNTPKLTWLAETDSAPFTPTVCVHFDHLITKGVLKPDENFKDFVNKDSKASFEMFGDPLLSQLKKGDIIQIQRKGFYICDEPYRPPSAYSGAESPCILFNVPDGHSKPIPTASSKKKKAEGPTDPQQPAKKIKAAKEEVVVPVSTPTSNLSAPDPVVMATGGSTDADKLKAEIDAQSAKVREIKGSGADKATVDIEVKKLLALKADYKALTGQDLAGGSGKSKGGKSKGKSGGGGGGGGGGKGKKEAAESKQENKDAAVEEGGIKTGTRLGIEFKKGENLSEWYSQVITKAEMVEYYDVSGCYILRPWAYSIWERIQAFFDGEIKKLGVENCYFPMFVSRAALEREKEHIADFAPEVAWVTKSGQSDLAEPIAIRPTSETVMYPTFAKWVQSHRDLPIKINQWCNIVRWEFKHPQPFLRTREFLWQEGHTAHANKKDAEEEVLIILKFYQRVYEEILAISVIPGRKTEKEKFAGGDYTTTIEAFVSASGRAIQAATSHHLGQNFSKMFGIEFEDPNSVPIDNPGNKTQSSKAKVDHLFAYQNSWGLTTRSIGVMAMVHGDDSGLVLPPRVAQVQVIVIPCGITATLSAEARDKVLTRCEEFVQEMKAAGLRCRGDFRDNYSPGWKFYHWELKGVPMRVELGPRDIENKQCVIKMRDTGEKQTLDMVGAGAKIKDNLEIMHHRMLKKSENELKDNILVTEVWKNLCSALDQKQLIMAPFCGAVACEEKIKKDSARTDIVVEEGAPAMGAKSLCIPFDQPRPLTPGQACIYPGCGQAAQYYTLFGRSY